jgi:hypothetical protein
MAIKNNCRGKGNRISCFTPRFFILPSESPLRGRMTTKKANALGEGERSCFSTPTSKALVGDPVSLDAHISKSRYDASGGFDVDQISFPSGSYRLQSRRPFQPSVSVSNLRKLRSLGQYWGKMRYPPLSETDSGCVKCILPRWGRRAVVLRTMPTSQNRDMGHPAISLLSGDEGEALNGDFCAAARSLFGGQEDYGDFVEPPHGCGS